MRQHKDEGEAVMADDRLYEPDEPATYEGTESDNEDQDPDSEDVNDDGAA